MGKQVKPNNWNRTIFDRTTDGMTVVRDTEMRLNPRLPGRPVYDPFKGSAREYVWTDDAKCVGSKSELFQVSEVTDPGLEGISHPELRKFNLAKVEQAKAICEGCPVRATCLREAEPQDLFWSVRGGQTPLKLVPKPNGGAKHVPQYDPSPYFPWECKKHGNQNVLYRQHKGTKRAYCGACHNK